MRSIFIGTSFFLSIKLLIKIRIGRMYISLELPKFWTVNHEDEKEGKYYVSPTCNLKIFVHPCFHYIEHLLELAKNEHIKSALESLHNSSKMKF